jgi:hypothetical protein
MDHRHIRHGKQTKSLRSFPCQPFLKPFAARSFLPGNEMPKKSRSGALPLI